MNPSHPPEPKPKVKAEPGGISAKYGKVTIEKGTPFLPGERVFLIRSRDAAAIRAIARYRNDNDATASPEFLAELDAEISHYAQWQTDNASSVKLPD